MENSTFISQVITSMTSNKNRNGKIAELVDSADHKLPANRIAVTWETLKTQRQEAKIDAVKSGVPAPEMEVKPEHLLSFVQQVMNSCCWAARRVANSGRQKDLANGLDFSQSVAEQAGQLEGARLKDVEATLMDDFGILNELHSWLCSEMNYMSDLDPLFLFAEKVCVDEEQQVYEHTHMLMDFNDMMAVLEEKSKELGDLKAKQTREHAATHVFGAKQKAKKPAKKAA
jgi:hypothetical protein